MAKDYKNPAATSSLIVLEENKILLVKRKNEPYKGMWALPGGFLNCDLESLEKAAVRELEEETSLLAIIEDLELICVNSDPKRDPREQVIDHVYFVKKYSGIAEAKDDAAELGYFPLTKLPALAFDHEFSIKTFMKRGYHYLDHKF